jgi:hypothetical protein
MNTWKKFRKILLLLEKANEYSGGAHDSQHCRNFLNAYLIDISTEEAEDETEMLYELSAAEVLLAKLTQNTLLGLASAKGDIRNDLLKKYPVLECIDEILHVYRQLVMIESNQYASVLG